MALRISLLGIDEASLFETFGSLKRRKLIATAEKVDV